MGLDSEDWVEKEEKEEIAYLIDPTDHHKIIGQEEDIQFYRLLKRYLTFSRPNHIFTIFLILNRNPPIHCEE